MHVDRSALRTNQALIVTFSVVAFLLGVDRGGQWLAGFVGVAMAFDTALPGKGPFKQFYGRVVKPFGLLKSDVRPEDPAPHRFAQGMGAAFLLAAFALLLGGVEVAGWALTWVVVALALVNLTVDFCAGCFVYLQLGRLGWLPRRREAA